MAENERLRREIFTNEQLLNSKDEANKSYLQDVRKEFRSIENKYKEEMETMSMEYQDLRQLTVKYYEKIAEQNATIFGLERDLENEINLKNEQIRINE